MEKLTIKSLSNMGRGIAQYNEKDIEVPFALPKEVVDVEIIERKRRAPWAKLINVVEDSADREPAKCKHFQACGGCSLQHLTDAAYQDFKIQQVQNALDASGVNAPVRPPFVLGPHIRRRVDFWIRKNEDGISLGFSMLFSRYLNNMTECPAIHRDIEALLPPLRTAFDRILKPREKIHLYIAVADNGIDILAAGFRRLPCAQEYQALKTFAEANNLARLRIKIKKKYIEVHCPAPPYITLGGYKVSIEPNAFLQASKEADQLLAKLVTESIPETASNVVDLFCGRGTLSLPLVSLGKTVKGYECDERALAALDATKANNLSTEFRNLFEEPLSEEELNRYDSVVINPPRAGAEAQCREIAKSDVESIVYVSCNPETFASDAKTLIDGGYAIASLTPVDQFIWTRHVEVVGVFQKHPR